MHYVHCHTVQCCQQYCSALLHLIQAQQPCSIERAVQDPMQSTAVHPQFSHSVAASTRNGIIRLIFR